MPSVPQSLLWISLVVLWLFVLVPMLISKRDAVRRTSDVALATRVLNTAAGLRLRRRTGPAAGHRSDPGWQPAETHYTHPEDDIDDDDEDEVARTRSAAMTVAVAAKVEVTETEHVDADVLDDEPTTIPVGTVPSTEITDQMLAVVIEQVESAVEQVDSVSAADAAVEAGSVADDAEQDDDVEANDYEYVEDTSGLEAEAEPATAVTPVARRRRRFDSDTAAAVSVRKFRFRRRTVMIMVLSLAVSAALAYLVAPALWWLCGGVAGVTLFYLAYLRRQTRIEQQVRRRRMQRMVRARYGVENTHDQEFDVVPSRLQRPGAVVLEVDDEDPIFEHLDYAPVAHEYDLPRAAGQ